MEELLELKQLLQQGKIAEALLIVDELEEMSISDKVNKIDSYSVILLIHLIKQNAENRSTRSWQLSIKNAIREINKTNKRRKANGYYLSEAELLDILKDAYELAMEKASSEAYEGRYEAEELATMVDQEGILSQAMKLIEQG